MQIIFDTLYTGEDSSKLLAVVNLKHLDVANWAKNLEFPQHFFFMGFSSSIPVLETQIQIPSQLEPRGSGWCLGATDSWNESNKCHSVFLVSSG